MEGLWVSGDNNKITQVPDDLLASVADGDIRRRRLTGKPAADQLFRGNIVECRLEDIEFDSIDFARCDWKDCRIDRATFCDCNLGHASMISNAFVDCRFVRCRFPDTSISDCTFAACDFDDCDLTSIIVKSSRLEDCLFSRCTTSNRIIESSLLLRTGWRGMELALALVTGNFGLRRSELDDCHVVSRVGSGEEVSRSTTLAVPDMSPIERFRLAYFWNEEVDGDADVLEGALDLRNWSKDAVVQASFGEQLSSFAQFLLALYSTEESPLYPLLILHSRNFAFLEWLSGREELLPLYQVAAGVHLTLTRVIDSFVSQLTVLVATLVGAPTVHFAAEGPLDVSFFERFFAEQGIVGVRVISVRPRNSPLDLAAAFSSNSALVGAIALFLACRTRLELLRVGAAAEGAAAPTVGSDQPLIAFSAGFSKTTPAEYEVNMRTLLPRSLLLDLHLSVSVAVFKKARAVLVGLLTPELGDAALPHTPGPKGARSRRRFPPE